MQEHFSTHTDFSDEAKKRAGITFGLLATIGCSETSKAASPLRPVKLGDDVRPGTYRAVLRQLVSRSLIDEKNILADH